MKFSSLVSKLVIDRRDSSAAGPASGGGASAAALTSSAHAGAVIPYFKFSDFQRAMSGCNDPTAPILICANAADTIPHCVAHTVLLGISFSLLNDELTHSSVGGGGASNSSAPSAENSGLLPLSGVLTPQQQQQQLARYSGPSLADAVNERSILDVSAVKAATPAQILDVVVAAASRGLWLVLPEVSAMGLPAWTEVGKFLAAAAAQASGTEHLQPSAATAAAGATFDNNLLVSPHFRLITFLTDRTAALGRTLSTKIAQSLVLVDTRGAVRKNQELSALLSGLVPLPERQLSLLAIGIGDGRVSAAEVAAAAAQQQQKEQLNMTANSAATFSASIGSATQQVPSGASAASSPAATTAAPSSPHFSHPGSVRADGSTFAAATAAVRKPAGSGTPATFFVDWPCAAAYARVPVTLHTSDIATTSDYVDGALFALRETLLKSLRDLIATAKKLDQQDARARRAILEARAIRTGHDLTELEQIDEMRSRHSETHLAKLEKNPAWIYPHMYEWVLGCAPSVNVEKLPCLSHEEMTIDEIVWVHEGIGDATACLRGSWQLAPVCVKCALPSVRPDVTTAVNNKLIVEGRTLLSLRHPAILTCYGIAELPADLSVVQGGNMVLRPLLSAAAMHERWLDAQDDASAGDIPGGGGGGGSSSSSASPSAMADKTHIRQYALLVEPFEQSLEQLLVSSYDRNKPWTNEQILDVALSILRGLVHLADTMVHRAVCPANVVVVSGGNALLAGPRATTYNSSSSSSPNSGIGGGQQTNPSSSINNSSANYSAGRERSSPPPVRSPAAGAEMAHASSGTVATPDGLPAPMSLSAFASQTQTALPTASSSPSAALHKLQQQNRQLLNQLQELQQHQRIVCKLSHFSATMPTNRRCAPPWLVSVLAAKLPVRYCAPETFWGQFSPASDIWSFAVTLWTMLHYCRKQPYDGLAVSTNSGSSGGASPQTVLLGSCPGTIAEAVATGQAVLPSPGDHIASFFYENIILPCLARKPGDRPDARSLISTILLLKMQYKKELQNVVEFFEN